MSSGRDGFPDIGGSEGIPTLLCTWETHFSAAQNLFLFDPKGWLRQCQTLNSVPNYYEMNIVQQNIPNAAIFLSVSNKYVCFGHEIRSA